MHALVHLILKFVWEWTFVVVHVYVFLQTTTRNHYVPPTPQKENTHATKEPPPTTSESWCIRELTGMFVLLEQHM